MANRRVIKTHLKHDDGVKQLMKRSVINIKARMDYKKVDTSEPSELTPIIAPINEKMLSLKHQTHGGDESIKKVLETMDKDKLLALKRVFDKGISSGKVPTEEKLIQTCPIVMDEMNKIQDYIDHLNLLKDHVITTYAECYAVSYNQCRGSSVNFNNEKFINDVDNALAFREATRRFTENQNSEVNENSEASNSRCVIC